jgi:hypothetical protein
LEPQAHCLVPLFFSLVFSLLLFVCLFVFSKTSSKPLYISSLWCVLPVSVSVLFFSFNRFGNAQGKNEKGRKEKSPTEIQ